MCHAVKHTTCRQINSFSNGNENRCFVGLVGDPYPNVNAPGCLILRK